jgi:formamidopyrimidine-DNA glycosylase
VIELPEAIRLSDQINEFVCGRCVSSVVSLHTPHKLAWYYGEPKQYSKLLVGKTIGKASALGSMVEINIQNANLLFGEGAAIRFHNRDEPRAVKHQLLVEFKDGSAISFSIQMYGGVGCFLEGNLDNPYYKVAKEKPSPLSSAFDKNYFSKLISTQDVHPLSLKAFLATQQRIPGLGNGVLQDILFNAKLHPKKKINSLTDKEKEVLFDSVIRTLSEMVVKGGRNTEADLFGHHGGYETILCKNTVNKPCAICKTTIKKEAYMGGSIYYCEKCQIL